MQFSDITKTIHDAWKFSWPPLFICGIAYLISYFLNPIGTKNFMLQLTQLLKNYGNEIDQLKNILEPYGLTKLVPVIFLIIFIGFLYLINNPILITASNLPPHLSFSPDILNKNTMSKEEKLLLVRKYPAARHFNIAYCLALHDTKKGDESFTNRAEIYYKIHDFAKLALVLAIIFSIMNILGGQNLFYQLFKLILIFLVISFVWIFSLVGLLYQQEQQFWDDRRSIQLTIQVDAQSILREPISEEEKEKIKDNNEKKWWRIYFIDTYRFSWIKWTFLDN